MCCEGYNICLSDIRQQETEGVRQKHVVITRFIKWYNILLSSTGKLKMHVVKATLKITHRRTAKQSIKKRWNKIPKSTQLKRRQ